VDAAIDRLVALVPPPAAPFNGDGVVWNNTKVAPPSLVP
jgi:hypothetical protein